MYRREGGVGVSMIFFCAVLAVTREIQIPPFFFGVEVVDRFHMKSKCCSYKERGDNKVDIAHKKVKNRDSHLGNPNSEVKLKGKNPPWMKATRDNEPYIYSAQNIDSLPCCYHPKLSR
jgi:hypothetical protein